MVNPHTAKMGYLNALSAASKSNKRSESRLQENLERDIQAYVTILSNDPVYRVLLSRMERGSFDTESYLSMVGKVVLTLEGFKETVSKSEKNPLILKVENYKLEMGWLNRENPLYVKEPIEKGRDNPIIQLNLGGQYVEITNQAEAKLVEENAEFSFDSQNPITPCRINEFHSTESLESGVKMSIHRLGEPTRFFEKPPKYFIGKNDIELKVKNLLENRSVKGGFTDAYKTSLGLLNVPYREEKNEALSRFHEVLVPTII